MKKLYIIITAPFEVIGCSLIYAYKDAVIGIQNIKDAWNEI